MTFDRCPDRKLSRSRTKSKILHVVHTRVGWRTNLTSIRFVVKKKKRRKKKTNEQIFNSRSTRESVAICRLSRRTGSRKSDKQADYSQWNLRASKLLRFIIYLTRASYIIKARDCSIKPGLRANWNPVIENLLWNCWNEFPNINFPCARMGVQCFLYTPY